MYYRKKPVVIQAVQFVDTTDCLLELGELGLEVRVSYNNKNNPVLLIPTLEGTMTAQIGDFIIKGVNGEFYPCKPDIFEKTYALDIPDPEKTITVDDVIRELTDKELYGEEAPIVFIPESKQFIIEHNTHTEYIVETYGDGRYSVNRYYTPNQLMTIALFYNNFELKRAE